MSFAYLDSFLCQKFRISVLRGVENKTRIQVLVFHRWEIWYSRANSSCLHHVLANDGLASRLFRSLKLESPLLVNRVERRRPDSRREKDVEVEIRSIFLEMFRDIVLGEAVGTLQLLSVTFSRRYLSIIRCQDCLWISA